MSRHLIFALAPFLFAAEVITALLWILLLAGRPVGMAFYRLAMAVFNPEGAAEAEREAYERALTGPGVISPAERMAAYDRRGSLAETQVHAQLMASMSGIGAITTRPVIVFVPQAIDPVAQYSDEAGRVHSYALDDPQHYPWLHQPPGITGTGHIIGD